MDEVAEHPRRSRLRARWRAIVEAISWTTPTSTEIGVVIKSAIGAGLAWTAATLLTDVPHPVLAPLTAIVIVQVSVRASVLSALQRSAGVVLGVLLAVGVSDTLGLNAVSITGLVAVSLGFAQLVLRLPAPAARQVPISALVVLAAVGAGPDVSAWHRLLDTLIGAAVGVVVSFAFPASRLVDARQTIHRLGSNAAGVLESMGEGLRSEWTVEQTSDWRRRARTTRDRVLRQAVEAVGNSREAARWNIRDRRHVDVLGRYEEVLPRLERTAIGVSVISRGLDDHAHLSGETHRPMRSMGALLDALAEAVRTLVDEVLDPSQTALRSALDEVRVRRESCVASAARQARLAMEHDGEDAEPIEGEWLNYAAMLVQVDRIVDDLSAPLPSD